MPGAPHRVCSGRSWGSRGRPEKGAWEEGGLSQVLGKVGGVFPGSRKPLREPSKVPRGLTEGMRKGLRARDSQGLESQ